MEASIVILAKNGGFWVTEQMRFIQEFFDQIRFYNLSLNAFYNPIKRIWVEHGIHQETGMPFEQNLD